MWQKCTWFEFTLSSKNSQKNLINAGCGQDQVMLLSEYRNILYFMILLGCRNAERSPMPPASTTCTVGSWDMDLGERTIGHLFSCPPTWTAQQLSNHWCSWDWWVTKNCAVLQCVLTEVTGVQPPKGKVWLQDFSNLQLRLLWGGQREEKKSPGTLAIVVGHDVWHWDKTMPWWFLQDSLGLWLSRISAVCKR